MQIQYVPPEAIGDRSLFLQGPEVRHIVKVLRLGPGDAVDFTDGRGRFLHCRIDRCAPDELHAEILSTRQDPREAEAPWSTLGLALLKGDHFEIALEKCVELGVHRIIPLLAEHCVVRWKESSQERKLARWSRIAESAMKQSGRSWLPEIPAPVTIFDLADRFPEEMRWIVADEEEPAVALDSLDLPARSPRLGLVGPEGAFSPREKDFLREHGAIAVSLSPYRLRSETAAIALCAGMNVAGPLPAPDSV